MTDSPRRARWLRAASIAGAFALTLSMVSVAFAHAELVSADPVDGAIIAGTPEQVLLRFTEALLPNSSIQLVGAEGSVASGSPLPDDPTAMALIPPPLDPGAYVIRWTAATDDAHIERGEVSFAVTELPTPSPSPTPAPSLATDTPPSAPPPTASPAPSPDPLPAASPTTGTDSGSGSDVVVALGAVALVIGAATLMLLRRMRTR